MKKYIAAFVIVLVFNPEICSGFESAWEAEDIKSPAVAYLRQPESSCSLAESILDRALRLYQAGQSEKTIHRCPFKTSCSSFLIKALENHGFPLGLFAFIDRYLYRENKSAYFNYSLVKRSDGVYKLDDDYFLAPRQ